MDAGVAALLGAVIGSVGTLGAALLTGRLQGRSQREQWLRQVRRDAYAPFIAETTRVFRDVQWAVEHGLGPAALDQGGLDTRPLAEGIRALELAAAAVELEGPAPLGVKANALVHQYAGLALGARLGEGGEVEPFRPSDLERGRQEFLDEARSVLDGQL